MKTFAEKNIWSQPDIARRFPPHFSDTISARRNPMKYIIYHLWFTNHQGSSTDISSTMHGGDSRIKLAKPCQDWQTPVLSWSWAWHISASMVLFHWRTIDHCLISSGCWMLHFILRPGAHLGATILQVTLQQDWPTLGMRYGQQGDITSIFTNVGHNGIINRELDMFTLRKIQLKRWWVFSNFVMCEMAGQCHGSAMELISTRLIQVADNICNKYTAFDVCWHNYTITSYLLWNSPSKVILHVHRTVIWQTC